MQMKGNQGMREESHGRQSKEAKSRTFAAVAAAAGWQRNARSGCLNHPKEEEGECSECLVSRSGETPFLFWVLGIK